ncbi:hypothetical protein [Denitratisoma oestradiolicum]|nr:hypothetical protein [Denitratisoma oestradiolicum]TWO81404.1 hypothetical protein CBW56_04650 [Denitratisoma oestradiolicum]
MIEASLKPAALRMLAWGCLWSPLADNEEHQEAWEVLGLPGRFEDVRIEYWNSFHAGMPQPPVPVLLHALLQCEGAGTREDLMRVANYLEVEWDERRLPPDHLGPVCELYGLAIEREEPVLIDGLRDRYLRPWVVAALAALNNRPAMMGLVQRFLNDL